MRPDRMHCHQVIMRILIIRTGLGQKAANPLATACLLPAIIVPQIVGIIFLESTPLASASTLGFALLYLVIYTWGVRTHAR